MSGRAVTILVSAVLFGVVATGIWYVTVYDTAAGRCSRGDLGACAVLAVQHPASASFPNPIRSRAVYDPAGAIPADIEAVLEASVDGIEARTSAEVAVYIRLRPDISENENLADAKALMDQWGVGVAGVNNGLVVLVSLDETLLHGKVSLYAGAGMLVYLDETALRNIIDTDFIPPMAEGDLSRALVATIDAVDRALPNR